MVRAAAENIAAGHVVQGGSTLTQQLAKNLFLEPKRTFDRKMQEALLALYLESRYSKDQILTLYLNRVYFGAGVYGIEAAAERFFGKSANELTHSRSRHAGGQRESAGAIQSAGGSRCVDRARGHRARTRWRMRASSPSSSANERRRRVRASCATRARPIPAISSTG